MTTTAPRPQISKTLEITTVDRECGVVTAQSTQTVRLSVDASGQASASVNGVAVEMTKAVYLLETANTLRVVSEQRQKPLPLYAIGTQGAWELGRVLRDCGISRAQAPAYASGVLGRAVLLIAADTMTTAEGLRVAGHAQASRC